MDIEKKIAIERFKEYCKNHFEKMFLQNIELTYNSISKKVESTLFQDLEFFLTKGLGLLSEEDKSCFISVNGFSLTLKASEEEYYIQKAENLKELSITISKLKGNSKYIRKQRRQINRFGKYSSLAVKVEDSIKDYSDFIIEIMFNLFDIAYEVLYLGIEKDIKANQKNLGELFYSEFRNKFPDELVDQSWIYLMIDGLGFYLTDTSMRYRSLLNAEGSDNTITQSSIDLMSRFNSEMLPTDDILSKESIAHNVILPTEFDKVKYIDNQILAAEKSIYDSHTLNVIPIVCKGVELTIGVPSRIGMENSKRIKNELENIFTRVIYANYDKIRSYYQKMLRKSREEEPSIAEMFFQKYKVELNLRLGPFTIKAREK